MPPKIDPQIAQYIDWAIEQHEKRNARLGWGGIVLFALTLGGIVVAL